MVGENSWPSPSAKCWGSPIQPGCDESHQRRYFRKKLQIVVVPLLRIARPWRGNLGSSKNSTQSIDVSYSHGKSRASVREPGRHRRRVVKYLAGVWCAVQPVKGRKLCDSRASQFTGPFSGELDCFSGILTLASAKFHRLCKRSKDQTHARSIFSDLPVINLAYGRYAGVTRTYFRIDCLCLVQYKMLVYSPDGQKLVRQML